MKIEDVPSVKALREERQRKQQQALARAQTAWDGMDKNQRTAVRFGMFPAEVMAQLESEGFDGHEMSVALMEVASKNGGMRA